MNYILIDDFNGRINIICNDDGSGNPLIFENLRDAETASEENCQDGIIVPLSNSISLLKRIKSLFDSGKLLIEKETTEDRKNLIQLRNDIKELFEI